MAQRVTDAMYYVLCTSVYYVLWYIMSYSHSTSCFSSVECFAADCALPAVPPTFFPRRTEEVGQNVDCDGDLGRLPLPAGQRESCLRREHPGARAAAGRVHPEVFADSTARSFGTASSAAIFFQKSSLPTVTMNFSLPIGRDTFLISFFFFRFLWRLASFLKTCRTASCVDFGSPTSASL